MDPWGASCRGRIRGWLLVRRHRVCAFQCRGHWELDDHTGSGGLRRPIQRRWDDERGHYDGRGWKQQRSDERGWNHKWNDERGW